MDSREIANRIREKVAKDSIQFIEEMDYCIQGGKLDTANCRFLIQLQKDQLNELEVMLDSYYSAHALEGEKCQTTRDASGCHPKTPSS